MSDELAELLGCAPPPAVAALPESARAQLAGLIAAARAQQGKDLDVAFAAVVKGVPFPVRPIARRILGT